MSKQEWKNETCETCSFRVVKYCRRFPPTAATGGFTFCNYPQISTDGKFFAACGEWIRKNNNII